MNIFVCLKEIQNPELVSDLFRVDEERKEVIPVRDMPLVTSPFDEQAIEAALRIRDRSTQVTIVAVTFGPKGSTAALKRALSMGADSGIHIVDANPGKQDSFSTAATLCRAIEKAGPYDMILTGRQAADWDAGIVGCGMAELLKIPVVTFAKDVRIEEGKVVVERVLDDGFETVATCTPCVVTIANELGEPRKASLRETMRAAKKPILTQEPTAGSETVRQVRERLYIPTKDRQCEMFSGGSPLAVAKQIAARLRETKHL